MSLESTALMHDNSNVDAAIFTVWRGAVQLLTNIKPLLDLLGALHDALRLLAKSEAVASPPD